MPRDRQFLQLLAFLGVGLAVTLAFVGVDRWFLHPRPPETQADAPSTPADYKGRRLRYPVPSDNPPADLPGRPPWTKCDELAGLLREQAPGLRVVHPDGSAYCYVIDADVDEAVPDALAPATEEYADCWRGVVLCGADWAALHPDEAARGLGPHECLAGDFYLFGDVQLLERVRPAAEAVHFGPHRGTP